jgi:hypothetical protein
VKEHPRSLLGRHDCFARCCLDSGVGDVRRCGDGPDRAAS